MTNAEIQRHPFHLVDQSPWPFATACSSFAMLFGSAMWFHSFAGGSTLALTGFIFVLFCSGAWWRDVIREGTFEGHHTFKVQEGLKQGIILFIVSEIMFFVAWFWAFFSCSVVPSIELGGIWPPKGIEALNAFEVPLLNTIILLLSGATCTWAHDAIIAGNKSEGIKGLVFTVILGAIFTGVQAVEYLDASFRISDGAFGSTFFMATGFHGFHVLVGTSFLVVCLFRQMKSHFTQEHHLGFEAAAWYWHFVDVVWLFLFFTIYYWGGN